MDSEVGGRSDPLSPYFDTGESRIVNLCFQVTNAVLAAEVYRRIEMGRVVPRKTLLATIKCAIFLSFEIVS